MKPISSITTCLLLLAGTMAIVPRAHAGDSEQIRSESLLTTLDGLAQVEIRPITDNDSSAIAGAGWQSDFGCGVAAGAGLVLSATGILAPVGVALAAAGIYCALFL